MPARIAAIDQGTTSTRCIVFDEAAIIASAQKEHEQIYPRPGWVEHGALEIWQRTREVVAQALAKAGDVQAIGITNQRETTVVWDRNSGQPLCNAIVWQDTRTQSLCDTLTARGLVDVVREKTGLPIATYFSATKLRWILDNVQDARASAEKGDA